MARPLNPDGRRIRTIIITAPFLVASSLLLYKRLVLGEEQRRLPPRPGVVTPGAVAVQAPPRDALEGIPADVAAPIREAEEQARR
ncbi:hypothetical protein JCM3770_004004 [Rhodotorula araucariae]